MHAVRAQFDQDGIRRMPEAEPEVSPFLPSGYKQYSTVEKLQHNIMMIRTLMGWVSVDAESPCEAVPTITEDGLYSTYEWWYSESDPLWGGPGIMDPLHQLMIRYPPKKEDEWIAF